MRLQRQGSLTAAILILTSFTSALADRPATMPTTETTTLLRKRLGNGDGPVVRLTRAKSTAWNITDGEYPNVRLDYYLTLDTQGQQEQGRDEDIWVYFIPASDLALGYVEPTMLDATRDDEEAVVVFNEAAPGQPAHVTARVWVKDPDHGWQIVQGEERNPGNRFLGPEAKSASILSTAGQQTEVSITFLDGKTQRYRLNEDRTAWEQLPTTAPSPPTPSQPAATQTGDRAIEQSKVRSRR